MHGRFFVVIPADGKSWQVHLQDSPHEDRKGRGVCSMRKTGAVCQDIHRISHRNARSSSIITRTWRLIRRGNDLPIGRSVRCLDHGTARSKDLYLCIMRRFVQEDLTGGAFVMSMFRFTLFWKHSVLSLPMSGFWRIKPDNNKRLIRQLILKQPYHSI